MVGAARALRGRPRGRSCRLSLDDFVTTNFVSGTTNTLPIWVYGATRIGLPPQVNVMRTLLLAAGITAAVANVIVQRRRRQA